MLVVFEFSVKESILSQGVQLVGGTLDETLSALHAIAICAESVDLMKHCIRRRVWICQEVLTNWCQITDPRTRQLIGDQHCIMLQGVTTMIIVDQAQQHKEAETVPSKVLHTSICMCCCSKHMLGRLQYCMCGKVNKSGKQKNRCDIDVP